MITFYPNLSNEDLFTLYRTSTVTVKETNTRTILEQTLFERLEELIKENKRLKQDLDEALSKIEAMGGNTYYD